MSLMVRGFSAARPESLILSFTSPSPCEVHRPASPAAGTDREFGRWALTRRCEIKAVRKKLPKQANSTFCLSCPQSKKWHRQMPYISTIRNLNIVPKLPNIFWWSKHLAETSWFLRCESMTGDWSSQQTETVNTYNLPNSSLTSLNRPLACEQGSSDLNINRVISWLVLPSVWSSYCLLPRYNCF